MKRGMRAIAVFALSATLVLGSAAPAAAGDAMASNRGSVNVLFDAMILRPAGLAMTAVGAMLFAFPVAPVVAITRPTEFRKPLERLILSPARYTFVDPLGYHPED